MMTHITKLGNLKVSLLEPNIACDEANTGDFTMVLRLDGNLSRTSRSLREREREREKES